MQIPTEALPAKLNRDELNLVNIYNSHSRQDLSPARHLAGITLLQQCVWLAVVFSHSDLSFEDIQNRINSPRELSDETIFSELAPIWGNIDYFKKLVDWHKEKGSLKNRLATNNYQVFWQAALYGHLPILQYIVENVLASPTDEFSNMFGSLISDPWDICAFHKAFNNAAANGHLDIVKYLIEIVKKNAPNKLREMISERSRSAFQSAVWNAHLSTAEYLLNFPDLFEYAEQHMHEYGERYVNPFINKRLAALREQRTSFLEKNTDIPFDVSNEEAKLLFYVLRNLIRRNGAELGEDIDFLLLIPSVKDLVTQDARHAQDGNSLIRLAVQIGNETASLKLLDIPDVNRVALENNLYREERTGHIDLAVLARDRESATTALTVGEERYLQTLKNQYDPQIEAKGGVETTMQAFRGELIKRYEAHPATFKHGKKFIALPVTWEDFQRLIQSEKLTSKEQQAALQAYYKNTDHTAIRYLSKPNRWMHEHAPYVCANEDGTEKWANFKDYQELISLMYIASIDPKAPPTEGHTLESRFNFFIHCIASINRVHSWDQTRTVRNQKGRMVKEEYDDLEGDRPSCFSGVKRRVFEALQGHPSANPLTKDLLQQNINEYVKAHFDTVLQDKKTKEVFTQAWQNMANGDELTQGDWDAFQKLDLSQEAIAQFKVKLTEKYGQQFSESPDLQDRFDQAFALSTDKLDAHVMHFGEHVQSLIALDTAAWDSSPAEEKSADIETSVLAASIPELQTLLEKQRIWKEMIFLMRAYQDAARTTETWVVRAEERITLFDPPQIDKLHDSLTLDESKLTHQIKLAIQILPNPSTSAEKVMEVRQVLVDISHILDNRINYFKGEVRPDVVPGNSPILAPPLFKGLVANILNTTQSYSEDQSIAWQEARKELKEMILKYKEQVQAWHAWNDEDGTLPKHELLDDLLRNLTTLDENKLAVMRCIAYFDIHQATLKHVLNKRRAWYSPTRSVGLFLTTLTGLIDTILKNLLFLPARYRPSAVGGARFLEKVSHFKRKYHLEPKPGKHKLHHGLLRRQKRSSR
jgi:hypothetical protein